MRTEEIFHRMQEVWVFDQLEPEQKRLYMGRKPPRHRPAWLDKPPAKEEITEEESERRQDEFLKRHGI